MFVFNDTVSFPDHSFLHFSSSFDEDSSLFQQQPQNDILLHHLPLNELPSTFENNLGSESRKNGVTNDHDQIQSKKGSCKRDRHSKINTLRGPRDRRMRLSLPVAKEFFGLQDMLGFDKASKTVEWLLFQARHAIKKLSRDQQSFHDGTGESSLVSDGEVVSGIDETTTVVNRGACGMKEDRKATRKVKRGRVARKTAFHPMARECREKARARARARTREKQLQVVLQHPIEQIEGTTTSTPKLQDLSKISSSWSTQMEITNGEQLSRTRNQGIIDDDQETNHDCLMIMGRWSPSNSIYNSLQNNNGSDPQEHPFGDFQFLGKPWEPYNNHGIC